ncbi:MAG: transcriptional repressor AgaR [Gelidibacter sp.]
MEEGKSVLERRLAIVEEISQNSLVKIKDFVKRFNVSEVTIRKDLISLEEKGQLIRVRGGAIKNNSKSSFSHMTVNDKQEHNLLEKQQIGKAAAALIQEGDTIILDSGTTTLEVVKNLERFNNLKIITTALNVAIALNEFKRFNVIIPGGYLNNDTLSLTGHMAEAFLENFYCDKLFLGVDSFSIEKGLSTPVPEEAFVNQIMISIAKEVIAIFDSSKFHKRGFAFIANVKDIDTIITDSGIPQEINRKLIEMGKRVIIA